MSDQEENESTEDFDNEIPSVDDIIDNSEEDSDENKSIIKKVQEKVEVAKRTAQTVKRYLETVKRFATGFVKMILNPYFWLAVLIISIIFTVIMATMATVSTVGRNDMGDDCGAGAPSSVNLHSGGNLSEKDIEENAFMIMNWMMTTPFEVNGGKPMSKEQAAGMVANMHEETGSFDPSLIQEGALPPTASNDEVLNLAKGHTDGNKGAIGLFQHRSSRAIRMIEIAKSSNRQWNDAAVQLEHFKEELDKPEYHGQLLKSGHFFETGRTVREYTQFANDYFGSFRYIAGVEGAGNGANSEGFSPVLGGIAGENAAKYAEKLAKDFKAPSGSGGVSHCASVGDADYAGIIELAKSIAQGKSHDPWKKEPCVAGAAGPEYKDARDKQRKGGLTGIGTSNTCSTDDYADCGKATATIVTLLLDKDFPVAGTSDQQEYLTGRGKDKWKQITKDSDLQTGDVFEKTGPGHAYMYLGEVDGKQDIIYEASLDDYYPYLRPRYAKLGEGTLTAWRYVGPSNNGLLNSAPASKK